LKFHQKNMKILFNSPIKILCQIYKIQIISPFIIYKFWLTRRIETNVIFVIGRLIVVKSGSNSVNLYVNVVIA